MSNTNCENTKQPKTKKPKTKQPRYEELMDLAEKYLNESGIEGAVVVVEKVKNKEVGAHGFQLNNMTRNELMTTLRHIVLPQKLT